MTYIQFLQLPSASQRLHQSGLVARFDPRHCISFGKTEHRVLARPFGRFADRAKSRGARRLPETASKA
jgi:hypothetical protein